MNKLYKKELILTLLFTVLLLITGYTATFFVAFPSLQAGTVWGFPTHYIIPIVVGWFGVAGVSVLMAHFCNKLDDELDAYTSRYNETAGAKEEK